MNNIIPNKKFFSDIKDILNIARAKTYSVENTVMVETYWKIGKRIFEEEQKGKSRAEYGEKLIENLSIYLTDTFGKGFLEANLKNMRRFYVTFPKFVTHCVANLSWTNIRTIMRIEDKQEREYYLKEASSQNWSSRVLERNIKSGYYKRILSSQKKQLLNKTEKQTINDFIKDPYVLEFLNVPENLQVNIKQFCLRKKNW